MEGVTWQLACGGQSCVKAVESATCSVFGCKVNAGGFSRPQVGRANEDIQHGITKRAQVPVLPLASGLRVRLAATLKPSTAQRTTWMHAFLKPIHKTSVVCFWTGPAACMFTFTALCFLPVFCFCCCCYDFAIQSTNPSHLWLHPQQMARQDKDIPTDR